ncbi:hypothetical protein CC79DRAFT_1132684 [Sarocladium strictum]
MPQKRWSMFPGRSDEIAKLLQDDNLNYSFETLDRDGCEQTYDTNIMGRFTCYNPTCPKKAWSSKVIPITIRKYQGQKYNARVYHQRCKSCNMLSKPRLDDSYAERIVYRLKIWSGVDVKRPPYNEAGDGRPHMSKLCEGCKAGHCKWTTGEINYKDD